MGDSDITNYDTICNTYLEHVEAPSSWNNIYERPYMLSIFDSFAGKHVLDLGCASGFYTLYALEQGAVVTALDASREMINYIGKKTDSEKLTLLCSDLAEGFPGIADESQDYIVNSLVLHYIENWEPVIKECTRVLKPGGKMYLSTHHPFGDYLHLKKENYFEKTFVHDTWGSKKKPFTVHYYTRTLTEVLKPFLKPELKILNIEEPLPDKKYRSVNEEAYKRISEKPQFLFITIQKTGAFRGEKDAL